MPVLERLCKEIGEKIREENLYPEEIIKLVEGLKPSEQFLKFVSEVFSKFSRKCNQDAFLAKFYGEVYKNWKSFFPACDKQVAVNVLFINFPQKLITYHKQFIACEVDVWLFTYIHFRKYGSCPVWKVCILQPRSRARNFDVSYIIYIKFLKSRARNLQTFQSGIF